MKADEALKKSKQMLAAANPEIFGDKNIKIDGNNNRVEINNYMREPKQKTIYEVRQHNPEIHILPEQQQKIKELVLAIGDMCRDILEEGKYPFIYAELTKKFKTSSYKLILQKDFNKAISFLKIKQMILLEKIRGVNAARYKQYMIPKLEQLWNINKNKIENSENLNLLICANYITKKNRTSIDNFSTTDLRMVYQWFYHNFIKK